MIRQRFVMKTTASDVWCDPTLMILQTGCSHHSPRVSIITTTLNAADALPLTIASLRAQQDRGFEWIVVDGGSSDGTVACLAAASDVVTTVVIRSGAGVADGWNAALEHASGQWLLFLGAGDELGSPNLLSGIGPVLDSAYPEHTMVNGRIALIEQGTRSQLEVRGAPFEVGSGKWVLFRPLLPTHPEVFHHRSLFDAGERFDPRYRYAPDTDFLLRQALRQRFLFVPLTVTRMEFGGITGQLQSLRAVSLETREIAKRHGFHAPLLHRCTQHLKLWIADRLAQFLPAMVLSLIERRWRRWRAFITTRWKDTKS